MISSIEPENMGMSQDFASINGLNGGMNIHGNQRVLAVYYQGTSGYQCMRVQPIPMWPMCIHFTKFTEEKSEKWDWNPSSIMGIEGN